MAHLASLRAFLRANCPGSVAVLSAVATTFVCFLALLPLGANQNKEAKQDKGPRVDPKPRVQVFFEDGGPDMERRNEEMARYMRFGVVSHDPRKPSEAYKKLTYSLYGRTNSTVVRIDGQDRVFGKDGKWVVMNARPAAREPRKNVQGDDKDKGGGPRKVRPRKARPNVETPAFTTTNRWGGSTTRCIWLHDENIEVTQIVEVVPSEPVEIGGKRTRLLDTVRVRYRIANKDNKAHRVGLRLLLDTLVGDNDGVPFIVPGEPALVDTSRDYAPPRPIPAYVQALERADLKNPGVIALLTLKVGQGIEPPSRVILTRWPGASPIWEIPVMPMRDDSAVGLYWAERKLKSAAKREVGFAYGLGKVASAKGRIGLIVEGDFTGGGELDAVALVTNPRAGEKVTLKLPAGFTFVKGSKATQPVPAGMVGGRPVPVTWRIRCGEAGRYELEVRSSTGGSQSRTISVGKELK